MKPSEVIKNAIGVIERRGWCQGDFTNDTGAVCAGGALAAAVGGTFFVARDGRYRYSIGRDEDMSCGGKVKAFDAATAMLNTLTEAKLGGMAPVSKFNDLPSTTVEDILLLMKEGAKTLEGEGR